MLITDFGLSKAYGTGGEWAPCRAPSQPGAEPGRAELQPPRLTNEVITEGYVPPEILLGALSYGPEVDIWAVGCIFGELMLRGPFLGGPFQKSKEDQRGGVHQLNLIAVSIGGTQG